MNNIEFYKCHNYGHIARNCRYKMEPTMNEKLDHENKMIWKGKKVQDDHEKKEGNKVPTSMLSRFVTDCEESAVASVNDSSQDNLLNDTLF